MNLFSVRLWLDLLRQFDCHLLRQTSHPPRLRPPLRLGPEGRNYCPEGRNYCFSVLMMKQTKRKLQEEQAVRRRDQEEEELKMTMKMMMEESGEERAEEQQERRCWAERRNRDPSPMWKRMSERWSMRKKLGRQGWRRQREILQE